MSRAKDIIILYYQNCQCGISRCTDIYLYTEQKKKTGILNSLKLRIFHLNIVNEFIDIYNHQCFMVDMSC